jgi:single-strand DNA-binding protein
MARGKPVGESTQHSDGTGAQHDIQHICRQKGRCSARRVENRPKRHLLFESGEQTAKENIMSYSNINRVVLVGRLTSDPELRALPSGSAVCSLRLACNSTRKNSDGDYTEKPNFFTVSVFGPAGESVHRYMSRGRRVAVDGRLDWREWETPEGGKRQAVDIVAESVQFLDGRGDHSDASGATDDGGSTEKADGGEERELVGVGSGIEDDLVF